MLYLDSCYMLYYNLIRWKNYKEAHLFMKVLLLSFYAFSKESEVTGLTKKQDRFVKEYLVDLNATQAAIRAGYSPKTARQAGSRMLMNVDIKKAIDDQLKAMDDKTIATAEEVMKYLSSVMRGQSTAEVVMVEGNGDGFSNVVHVQKAPDERERLKAAELLGKRYGIYSDKVSLEGAVPVIITGEDDIED